MNEIIEQAAKMIAESELPNRETQAQEVSPSEETDTNPVSDREVMELINQMW